MKDQDLETASILGFERVQAAHDLAHTRCIHQYIRAHEILYPTRPVVLPSRFVVQNQDNSTREELTA